MSGYIFYEGLSLLDGKPIVGILTMNTTNRKTGPMLQTWILRRDIAPTKAVTTGEDRSVCGDCPLRGTSQKTRGCYVSVFQAPLAIYKKYRRRGYRKFDPDKHIRFIQDKLIRLGAYGEPVAIPLAAWLPFLDAASGHTGYTHQWRNKQFQEWRPYLMASVHSLDEAQEATALGWRYFRTVVSYDQKQKQETICLNDKVGVSCSRCLLCDGAGGSKKTNIIIQVHGSAATVQAAELITNLTLKTR
jgi:hypothetical protein